jgi:hypothetical protein
MRNETSPPSCSMGSGAGRARRCTMSDGGHHGDFGGHGHHDGDASPGGDSWYYAGSAGGSRAGRIVAVILFGVLLMALVLLVVR